MSMAIDPVEVRFLAEMSQLKRDMNEMKKMVAGSTNEAARAVGVLDGAFAGLGSTVARLGGVLAVGALTAWVKGTIDAADHLNDLSQSLGISVEDLAAWKLAADQSGTSLESIGKGIKGLASYMAEHSDRLKAAGITAKDSSAALLQFADLVAELPDGLTKAALVNKVLGKSGMELIPVLNQGSKGLADLAEKSKIYGDRMAALAPSADLFNDQLAELKMLASAAGAGLASDLMPVLNDVAADLIDIGREAYTAAGSFNPMAEALKAAVILFGNVGFVLKGIHTEVRGISAQIAALAHGDFTGFSAIGRMMTEDALRARKEFDKWEQHILGIGADSKLIAPTLPDRSTSRSAKARADALLGAGAEDAKKAKAEYDSLIKSIREKIAVGELELQQQGALTGAEKEAMRIMVMLRDGHLQLSDAKKIALTQDLETLIALEQANAALKEQEKQKKALHDATVKETETLQQQVKNERERVEAIGLTKEAQMALASVKLDVAAASRENTAAAYEEGRAYAALIGNNEAAAYYESLRDKMREQAAALRDLSGLKWTEIKKEKAALDEMTEFAKQAAKNMQDAMGDFFFDAMQGKMENMAQRFKQTLDRMVADLLASQLLKYLVGDFGTGGSNVIGGVIGGWLNSGSGGGWSDSQFATQAAAEAAIPLEAFGGYHGGGIAGLAPTFTRWMPASVFADAPRLHGGGLAGNEVPAVLQKGEGVFTKEQMRALGVAGGHTINMPITFLVQGQMEHRSQQQISAQVGGAVNRALRRLS